MRMMTRAFLLAALAAAVARAAFPAEGRPRLLAFGSSDSCEWCKVIGRRVYVSDVWRNWVAGHVEFVRVDLPRGDGVLPPNERAHNNALADRLNVTGIPTFVLLSPDGDTELGRVKIPDAARGLGRDMTPEAFIAALEDELGRDTRGHSREEERPPPWRVWRFIPVVLMLGFAAFLLVDKSKLPLALRGLKKMLGGAVPAAEPAASTPVPAWKRLLAFVLVLAAFILAVL